MEIYEFAEFYLAFMSNSFIVGGGCTQSAPVLTRTHATVPEGQLPPVTTAVSQSMISVVWQGPSLPNGPNVRFELSRLKIREPLNRKF